MRLKIITINVEAGSLLDSFLAFVQAEQPDILLLQEVFVGPEAANRQFHILECLREMLPHYQVDHAPTYDTYRGGLYIEAGNAILSTFPIISREVFFYGIPYMHHYVEPTGDYSLVPRNLQYVQLDTSTTPVHVFNTHGIWSSDIHDKPERLQMSQIIVEQVRGRSPVILGGDFNTVAHTRTIDLIERHLVNVFKDKVYSTLNMRRKRNAIYANLAIDMLFVSQDVVVTRTECPQVDISDHLPLIAEVTI